MKSAIHPKLKTAKVICTGCGNEFETLSVKENITVSLCSNCHPFFTGTKKLIDTEGRVQKFEKRYQKAKDQQQKQQEERKKLEKKKALIKKIKK